MSDEARAALESLTSMNPAYQHDPHAVLRPWRERCPVARDDQAGAFIVTGYEEARRVVADTIRDGGFPPLVLEPIDFGQLYLQQAQAQAAAGEPAGTA